MLGGQLQGGLVVLDGRVVFARHLLESPELIVVFGADVLVVGAVLQSGLGRLDVSGVPIGRGLLKIHLERLGPGLLGLIQLPDRLLVFPQAPPGERQIHELLRAVRALLQLLDRPGVPLQDKQADPGGQHGAGRRLAHMGFDFFDEPQPVRLAGVHRRRQRAQFLHRGQCLPKQAGLHHSRLLHG